VLVFLAAIAAARQVPDLLNGSLPYAPAILLAVGFGIYHSRTQPRERLSIPSAVVLLAAAVFLRTIDNAVCAAVPIGTHFLWHLTTAAALYLFGRALVGNLPSTLTATASVTR